MSEQTPPIEAEDAAWASLNTPLSVAELREFCADTERLFRINPMLEFNKWQALGNNHYLVAGRNISQDPPFDFEHELHVSITEEGIEVSYSAGVKTSTLFRVEPAPQGSRLTIVDRYDGIGEDVRKKRLAEVDRSLVVWANYLQKFLLMWQRWSGHGWWRWYMRRVWQPMKPSARRITYMLLWISVVEITLIVLGAAIYFVEYS